MFHILALYLQLSRLPLNLIQIMVRQIILRLQIQADDPLYQGICHFTVLIVYQSQQILASV